MNWLDIIKGMPSYIADGFRSFVSYWRAAHPVLWILQTIYLVLFAATFWFVISYTVSIGEGTTMPTQNTIAFWWIVFFPFSLIIPSFLVWGIYRRFARYIIKKFEIPFPDGH